MKPPEPSSDQSPVTDSQIDKPAAGSARVLAVCGMRFEAKLLDAQGVRPIWGQEPGELERQLDLALSAGCTGLVSFGTAGGLEPTLKAGSWVVAEGIVTETDRYACDPRWSACVARRLAPVQVGLIASVFSPVMDAQAKEALFGSTGALAVDMESGRAARLAQRHKVPFIACRVVVDPAWRSLPQSAVVGLRADGGVDLGAILKELARHPGQIVGLLTLAADAALARRALADGLARLGPNFGV